MSLLKYRFFFAPCYTNFRKSERHTTSWKNKIKNVKEIITMIMLLIVAIRWLSFFCCHTINKRIWQRFLHECPIFFGNAKSGVSQWSAALLVWKTTLYSFVGKVCMGVKGIIIFYWENIFLVVFAPLRFHSVEFHQLLLAPGSRYY